MAASDLKDVRKDLEDGVKAIIEGGDFQHYLDFMSGFYNYSPSNVMLILTRRPDATMVAGYRAWVNKGRFVRKGEKGIPIIVPFIGKKKAEDGSEEKGVTRFGVGYVFDVSQTEGEALPELDIPSLSEEGQEITDVFLLVGRLAERLGIPVTLEAMEEGTMGYFSRRDKRVALREDIGTGLQGVKTFLHELAHSQTDDIGQLSRGAGEAVAEGVAYVVCRSFGLDTSSRSFPYIATWITDHEKFLSTMGHIQKISTRLIYELDDIKGKERIHVSGGTSAVA